MHEALADRPARICGADTQQGLPHQHPAYSGSVRVHLRDRCTLRKACRRSEAYRCASNDAVLAESERAELIAAGRGAQVSVDVRAPIAEPELATLNAAVENKRLDGYLWLNVRPGTRQLDATYVSRGSADFLRQRTDAGFDRPRAGSGRADEAWRKAARRQGAAH